MKHDLKIGLGTAAIGRPQYINVRQESELSFSLDAFKQHGTRVLDEAYGQGIKYFDTAPGYGLAEKLLIDWISDRKYEDVEIATKWGYTYVANFDPEAAVHEVKEHSLSKLNEQWEQSRNLLPHLSSYQIHSATLDSGVFENQEALDRLWQLKKEFGLLIGLTSSGSNQAEIIKKSLSFERDGQSLFDIFQVTYNVFDQSLAKVATALTSQNKRIVVKEALANGRVFSNPDFPQYADMYKKLEKLASKYEVGIDAIALRFCLESINPFMALSGASEGNHIAENLKTNAFKLEENELTDLKNLAVDPEHYWKERSHLIWN